MDNRKVQAKVKKVMVFILLLCAIVVFSNPVTPPLKAKKFTRSGAAFDESSKIINVGIGVGSPHYFGYWGNGYHAKRTPAFSVSYEQPLKNKLGPGYLGLGAYVGFQLASYRNEDFYFKNEKYYYQHSYYYLHVAARGIYHADALIFEKGEIYFGAMLGLRYQGYKFSSNSPDPDAHFYEVSNSSIYGAFSVLAGGRWYFAPKAALFAELGYGISYLTLGVSFKV